MNRYLKWLINLAVIYGLCVGAMLLARRALIYPFDETPAWTGDLPGVKIETVARPDGSNIVVWVAEPEPGMPVIFFFMGNIGQLEYFDNTFRDYREAGLGLVAMAYRGGGGADGQPSEIGLTSDARLVWDAVGSVMRIQPPEAQRIIVGQSLGTGLAADLATATNPGGVVLISPFTRLCKVIENRLKVVPACALMWDEVYPVIDQLPEIGAPVLLLHGTDDALIPSAMSEELAARVPAATLKLYAGGRHNDLRQFGSSRDTIAFARSLK